MKHIKQFDKLFEASENVELSDKLKRMLLRLANMVSSEISGSNVHPSEDFDMLDIYTELLGEDNLMMLINKMLDERINREHSNSEEYDTHYKHFNAAALFVIDIDTFEIKDGYGRGNSISWYDIQTLLMEKRKLASNFIVWDEVKKLKR